MFKPGFFGNGDFVIADGGLAFVTVLALIRKDGSFWCAIDRIGKWPAKILATTAILTVGPLLCIPRTRRAGVTVALALVLDLIVCNGILKPLFDRVRPCVVNPAVELLVRCPTDASFPSGHTAASFAAVSALVAAGSRLWIPGLVLAVLIAVSRLYLYVHWPTDVLAGGLLGWGLGCLARSLLHRMQDLRK